MKITKEELERQYHKGVITHHELILSSARLEGRITREEYDAIFKDIENCFKVAVEIAEKTSTYKHERAKTTIPLS